MNIPVFEQLHNKDLLSSESLKHIGEAEGKKNISVHWDLKTLLYTGVLLLTTGLGIIVYKNIDTIGHLAILIFIALLSVISEKLLEIAQGSISSRVQNLAAEVLVVQVQVIVINLH